MVVVSIHDPETIIWLSAFPNKSKVVNKAVMEYKARHYDGQYFKKEEIEFDIEKKRQEMKELEDTLKILNEKEKSINNPEAKN